MNLPSSHSQSLVQAMCHACDRNVEVFKVNTQIGRTDYASSSLVFYLHDIILEDIMHDTKTGNAMRLSLQRNIFGFVIAKDFVNIGFVNH